jgi:hypothetical protein
MLRTLLALMLFIPMWGTAAFAVETPVTPKKEAKSENPGLSTKEISSQMADVWCQKMEECTQKKEMGVQECKKVLFKSFKEGFENISKTKPVDVNQETLSQCVANIKKDTCNSLKNAQSIPSCEFISLLNQSN